MVLHFSTVSSQSHSPYLNLIAPDLFGSQLLPLSSVESVDCFTIDIRTTFDIQGIPK